MQIIFQYFGAHKKGEMAIALVEIIADIYVTPNPNSFLIPTSWTIGSLVIIQANDEELRACRNDKQQVSLRGLYLQPLLHMTKSFLPLFRLGLAILGVSLHPARRAMGTEAGQRWHEECSHVYLLSRRFEFWTIKKILHVVSTILRVYIMQSVKRADASAIQTWV